MSEAFQIFRPASQAIPLVLASPHSGRNYTPDFLEMSQLDAHSLRRSEDYYVEQLFGFAPSLGAPLIAALFPRAYVDVNREPYELDPSMFSERLPNHVNSRSPRVAAGLGTLARLVANGAEIYKDRLSFQEAEARIERFYRPYHGALSSLIEETRQRFGFCILLDCHSMPSGGAVGHPKKGKRRIDMVLGDCHGTSCAPELVSLLQQSLAQRGYRVHRNTPYAGGFTTQHYGRPDIGLHAIQIEINRGLYMNEQTLEPLKDMTQLSSDLAVAVSALSNGNLAQLAAE